VRYKVPRSFERVEGHVRDDAGKVRRGALAAERTGVVDGKESTT
jgi:bile acid-coenzyme A ligase